MASKEVLTSYTVATETSNLPYAGTDANVTIILHGAKGDSQTFDLKNSSTKGRKFARGKSDVFQFTDVPSVGELNAVTIAHDNAGIGGGWHLKYVDVHDSAGNSVFHFPCERWLAKDEEDRALSRKLPCAKALNKAPKSLTTSKLTRSNP